MSGLVEDTKDMRPAMRPRAPVLRVRDGLEHVLNGPSDRRDRTGLAQPRAATLREERPRGRPPGIPREKNDPLAQGRILTRQDSVEGWSVQFGHVQVTYNHVITPLLEQGEGTMAIVRRADAMAIPAQQTCQGADHARLIVNHENCPSDMRGHVPSLCTRSRETICREVYPRVPRCSTGSRGAWEGGATSRGGAGPPRAGSLEDVLYGTPDCGDRAGLRQPWLAALRQERHAVGAQGITGEKNHPLAQRGILTRQDIVEGWSVKLGHPQVTQNDVIALLLKPCEGTITRICRLHRVALPAQQHCQRPDKAWRIINHQNR